MMNTVTSKQKAELIFKLHHTGNLLVLPNIWDPLGALLLEDLGYPAVATASASVAFTNGLNDGENISFRDLLSQLNKITGAISIPVSADIEKGYADNEIQLEENIEHLIDAGVVGINIEDTDKKTNVLLPIETQCRRIQVIKETSAKKGIPLFINARTDIYIRQNDLTSEEKLQETLKRGKAYKEAGADCFYPIAMKDYSDIKTTVGQLRMPVNIITIPGIPDLKILNEIGVARVSLGPSFLKIAVRAMKNLATQLLNYEGLDVITGNEITSDYLKTLINKNKSG